MNVHLRHLTFFFCAATLAAAIVGGGSSQYAMNSTAMVELASLPLLGFGLWLAVSRGFVGLAWPLAILAAGIAVAAIQMIPVPVKAWTLLPGRAAALAAMDIAGAHPAWAPASLNAARTEGSLLSVIPGVAVFLGVAALDWRPRRRLVVVLLALGVVSAIVGLAQAAGMLAGFYTVTNAGAAVGFFANRNHFAALLVVCLPFAIALGGAAIRAPGRRGGTMTIVASSLFCLVVLLAVCASGSRAGLALTVCALMGGAMLFARDRTSGRAARVWIGPALIGAVILLGVLQFTGLGTLGRRKAGPFDEGRYTVAVVTLRAANAYAPWGAGLGTFVPIFAAAEPDGMLSSEYVNHAHDDWVELWLEGGVPLAIVVAGFLVWFGLAAARAWTSTDLTALGGARLDRAGSLSVVLLLLHSTVDYPMRTGAVMAVFGLACAMLVAPTSRPRTTARGSERRRIDARLEPASAIGTG